MKAIIDCEICARQFEAEFRGQRPLTCSVECWTIRNSAYNKAYRKSDVLRTLRSVVAGCKNRAKRRNQECDIDASFMCDLYDQQSGRCAMTDILLESSAANTKTNSNPWTISVDRIDNSKGYIKGNVRLVTYMYNVCKGTWTDEQVKKMCEGQCGH